MSDSPWNQPGTVEGFVRSPPNDNLLQIAQREWRASARLLDIGCGAARNALPALLRVARAAVAWREARPGLMHFDTEELIAAVDAMMEGR